GNNTLTANTMMLNINVTYGSVNGTHSALRDTIANTGKLLIDLIIWIAAEGALLGACILYLITKKPFEQFISTAEDVKTDTHGKPVTAKFHGHRFLIVEAKSDAKLIGGFGVFGRKDVPDEILQPRLRRVLSEDQLRRIAHSDDSPKPTPI